MNPRRRVLGLGVATLLLAACTPPARPHFRNTDITGADFGKAFAWADVTGRTRHLDDFKGQVVVLFFGYTQCPDVCPTTLSALAQTVKRLGAAQNRVQVIFVSVDPERDTPQLLKEYVPTFNPRFIALRPTPAQMAALKHDFRIVAEKSGDIAHGRYSVDHSAGLYVYDPQGRLRLFVAPDTPSEALAADLTTLLAAP